MKWWNCFVIFTVEYWREFWEDSIDSDDDKRLFRGGKRV